MVIKTDGRDGVFIVYAIGDCFDEGCFACVLQSDYGDFQLFVEEFAFDPVEYFVKEAQHLTFNYKPSYTHSINNLSNITVSGLPDGASGPVSPLSYALSLPSLTY